MVKILLGLIALLILIYLVVFLKDLKQRKDNNEKLEEGSFVAHGLVGLVVCFGDTLGIGGFAPMTSLYREFSLVKDRILPGTLNTAMTIPVMVESLIFIKKVEVEPITLITMLISATLGGVLGAGFISRLNEKKVRLYMGLALLAVVVIMTTQQLGLIHGGGNAMGLTGFKLVIAVVANFVLGILMTLGIGLYAPCMAVVYALGLSPLVAFPVMMGSCAVLMPIASIKFVREGAYNRKATLMSTIFGLVGVLIAVFLITSLPLKILTILVTLVLLYTAVKLILDSIDKNRTNKKEKKSDAQLA